MSQKRYKRLRFCCKEETLADTGSARPGHHNHPKGWRYRSLAINHPTGTGFRKDKSTTKAVLRRMIAIGAAKA